MSSLTSLSPVPLKASGLRKLVFAAKLQQSAILSRRLPEWHWRLQRDTTPNDRRYQIVGWPNYFIKLRIHWTTKYNHEGNFSNCIKKYSNYRVLVLKTTRIFLFYYLLLFIILFFLGFVGVPNNQDCSCVIYLFLWNFCNGFLSSLFVQILWLSLLSSPSYSVTCPSLITTPCHFLMNWRTV